MNSRAKGARGEREFASLCRENGLTARRGQQFSGSPDSPDVLIEELHSDLHVEVKRVQQLNLSKAMSQAVGDAGDKVPMVAHRKNNEEWMLTFKASDIMPHLLELIEMKRRGMK